MITSPVSLSALEAIEVNLPASPASIPADIALADLEQIHAGWIAKAKAEQIPERLYDIGYWLGRIVDTLYEGTHREMVIGDIRIAVGVMQTSRNVAAGAWNTKRSLYAYSGVNLVMAWSWHYTTQDIEDAMGKSYEGTDLLYIPGDWTAIALSASSRAEKTRIGIARSASFAERNALARCLLVGIEI